MTRPLRIVGLMAVLALAGSGCAGSDGTPLAQTGGGAPVTTTIDDGEAETSVADTSPSDVDAPTCATAVDELDEVLAGAPDLAAALVAADGATAQQAVAGSVGKVLAQAAEQADEAGQDAARDHLEVLAEMAADVRAALADAPSPPLDAFTPQYFEHGYAAAGLRDLAATANLAPCGQVADLVVGTAG